MARFITFASVSMMISLSFALWDGIGIFGIKNIIADQTNTVTGTLVSFAGCSSTNGVLTSCANNLLTGISIVSIALIAAGGTTVLAFGNTYLAQGLLLAFVPTIMTLYDTITTVLDVFGVGAIAPAIGGMFAAVFVIAFVGALITVQGKVYISP